MSVNVYAPEKQKIVHNVDVDMIQRPSAKTVHLVQNDDKLPVIAVRFFSDTQPYFIPEDSGSNTVSVNLKVLKPDAKVYYVSALGISEDRRTAYYCMDVTATNVSGEMDAYAEIIFGDQIASSSPVHIIVDSNPSLENADVKANEWNLIHRAVMVAASVGNLSELDTNSTSTLVAAINEVFSDLNQLARSIGDVSGATGAIGNLSDLNTNVTDTIVAAINSVNTYAGQLGVGFTEAVNNLYTVIGTLSKLNTNATTSLVDSINEVNGNVGQMGMNLSNSITTLQGALNALSTNMSSDEISTNLITPKTINSYGPTRLTIGDAFNQIMLQGAQLMNAGGLTCNSYVSIAGNLSADGNTYGSTLTVTKSDTSHFTVDITAKRFGNFVMLSGTVVVQSSYAYTKGQHIVEIALGDVITVKTGVWITTMFKIGINYGNNALAHFTINTETDEHTIYLSMAKDYTFNYSDTFYFNEVIFLPM